MQAQLSVNEFNGNILVAKKGKIIFRGSYGKADREWNVDNTSSSIFRIASITKQFTAASILLLAEEKKLDLNDRLSKYILDYPKGDSITIHMLLNHTSGIKSYTDLPEFPDFSRASLTPDSLISFFKNKPLDFTPGTSYHYNNSGYALLGFIIEKVSKETYPDFLKNHIFKKAGMENSAFDVADTILPFRVRGYSRRPNGFINAPFIPIEIPYSAGGIRSTTEDLYKWTQKLMSNQIISAASLKKMTTRYKENYGYGVEMDSLQHGLQISHGGSIPGFSTYMTNFPAEDICIVVLSNNESNSYGITEGLTAIVFDTPVEMPYEHKETPVDIKLLEKYVGTYKGPITFQVIKKENKLYRHVEGRPDIELKPESNTKLFYGDGSDRQLEFEVNKDNEVVKFFLIVSGAKIELKKLKL